MARYTAVQRPLYSKFRLRLTIDLSVLNWIACIACLSDCSCSVLMAVGYVVCLLSLRSLGRARGRALRASHAL